MTTFPAPAPSTADNPWLHLILDSNKKDPKNPTAYWNAMQDGLIQYEFWPPFANYSHSFTKVFGRNEVKEFYRKLCNVDANELIDFSGLEFANVSFFGAIFLRSVNFASTKFLVNMSFE